MAAPQDLSRLLAGENDRVEWKQSTGQRDPILNAVCALANDLGESNSPGFIVIGIDKTGKVRGVEPEGDLDQQQKDLADRLRSSKIQPVPSASVTVCRESGEHLIVVKVEPYPVPPVVEVDGVAWVRVGSTTRRASQADMLRLTERRPLVRVPFDTRPFAGTHLADLDTKVLRTMHSIARDGDDDPASFPAFESWLTQRQLGRLSGGDFVPNAAALLLHGKSPQDHLPAAWIDLVRYGGKDLDAPIVSRRSATGSLSDQLQVAWSWVAAQIENLPEESAGIRSGFVANYPEEALKELVRNLVQHRLYEGTHAPGRVEWFDDRIEFSNPGRPFRLASEGEFGTHSDYRNPLITARLVEAGYVQQLGRGVRRARLQLEKNGNPPLEVETDGFTRVIVRRRP